MRKIYRLMDELNLDEKTELLGEFERKIGDIEMRHPLTVIHEAALPGVED